MAALVRFKMANGEISWIDPDAVVAVVSQTGGCQIWLEGGGKIGVEANAEKAISLLNLQFGGAQAD